MPTQTSRTVAPLFKRCVWIVLAALILLSPTACVTHEGLRPFSTDGCSLFPDRCPFGKADWCSCCLVHDLAYWRGGSADERRAADRALRACVLKSTGSSALATLMYAGVRVGGSPYVYTPFRWGFGWPYGRPYGPLSASEYMPR